MMSVWAVSNLMGISLIVQILFTCMWGKISLNYPVRDIWQFLEKCLVGTNVSERPDVLLNIPQHTGHSPTTSSLGPDMSISEAEKTWSILPVLGYDLEGHC